MLPKTRNFYFIVFLLLASFYSGRTDASQSIAVDPAGKFVLFTAPTATCSQQILQYLALDSSGNSIGTPTVLTPCGFLSADIEGIDVSKQPRTSNYWISFGGSLATDSRYLMAIDQQGNILVAPTAVLSSAQVGSTTGATAIAAKRRRIIYWTLGANGDLYRAK